MPLTQRSIDRLTGVHPDLVRVVTRAAESCHFIVVEGVRTLEKQREYFQAGKSKTMKSRHLTGHAVDLCPEVDTDGDGDLELSWAMKDFLPLIKAMMDAAKAENVQIRSGADWNGNGDYKDESFVDAPHFELSKGAYP